MSPMGVQSRFEAVHRGRADHFSWQTIPVIHDPDCEDRTAHSRGGRELLELERMSSRNAIRQREDRAWVRIDPSVKQLIREDHITSTAPVVQ